MNEPYSEWLAGVPDKELAYYQHIETYFSRKGGFPWIVRGRDWMIARSWFEQDIPLFLIEQAIDEYFSRADPNSAPRFLGYIDPVVQRLWKTYRLAFVGRIRENPDAWPTFTEIHTWFRNWSALLEESRRTAEDRGYHAATAVIDKFRKKLARIEAILENFAEPNVDLLETLETKLDRFEHEFIRELRKALPPETLRELEDRVTSEIREAPVPYSPTRTSGRWVRRQVDRFIRRLFHLPDFSIVKHVLGEGAR